MKNNGNAYTNWETWVTMLWYEEMFRDWATEHIDEMTQYGECIELFPTISETAIYLQDRFEDATSVDRAPWCGLFQDFIDNAMAEINWREIAETLIDEM